MKPIFYIGIILLIGIIFVSPATSAPGDTNDNPIQISPGTTSGTLGATDDIIWYSITATVGNSYSISLSSLGSNDFDLYVVDTYLDYVVYSETSDYPEEVAFIGDDTFYYIVVHSYEGSGSFSLVITETDAPTGIGSSFNEAEQIQVDTYSRELTASGFSYYFNFTTEMDSYYRFELRGTSGTDFDLYRSDGYYVLDSSENQFYPEVLTYNSYSNTTFYIIVHSYYGSGTFTLSVSKIITLSSDYFQIDSNNGFDLYRIDNTANKQIDIQMERIGYKYLVAFVDTDFSSSIIMSLTYKFDETYNPHLLYDTWETYGDNMDNFSISYIPDINTVYVVVYSIEVTSDYPQVGTGYKLDINVPSIKIQPSDFISQYLPYDREFAIHENGDTYRDDNEWVLLTNVEIPAGEIFELFAVGADDFEFGIVLFTGNTASDLNAAIRDVNDWDGTGQISSTTYAAGLGIGLAYIAFHSSSTITANIAIFSNSEYNSGSYVHAYTTHQFSQSSQTGTKPNSFNTDSPINSIWLTSFSIITVIFIKKKITKLY